MAAPLEGARAGISSAFWPRTQADGQHAPGTLVVAAHSSPRVALSGLTLDPICLEARACSIAAKLSGVRLDCLADETGAPASELARARRVDQRRVARLRCSSCPGQMGHRRAFVLRAFLRARAHLNNATPKAPMPIRPLAVPTTVTAPVRRRSALCDADE